MEDVEIKKDNQKLENIEMILKKLITEIENLKKK
jgi:hypothetical protein